MAVGGSGLSHLFWVEPITPGDVASWLTDGVLQDGGSGGTSLSIGASIVGGTSPAVLFIGAGNVLAQDPTNFTWDDTNFILKIGHSGTSTAAYWVNGFPGLYGIPNVSGNNWFEANAGNTTLTGYLNFGTGDSCMSSLTTGFQNVAIGAQAMQHSTIANQNVAIGSQALWFTQSDIFNIAVGADALAQLGLGGAGGGANQNNVAIGFGALSVITTGSGNIAVGFKSLQGANSAATNNVAIGPGAGGGLGSSGAISQNTMIGPNCGAALSGIINSLTWIGSYQGTGSLTNSVGESIVISDGRGNTAQLMDYGLTTAALVVGYSVWSMGYNFHYATPNGLHIYNIQDSLAGTTNYERAILDWNATANVFRIGSQAHGTGTVRIIAIDGFQKAGAPAAADLPSGTWGLINDTTGGNTWLVYNNSGTIRKVQLV